MTDACIFCGQNHSFRKCPLFADKKAYLDTFAPKAFVPPPQAPPRASLAPTLFEVLYGEGYLPILQEVPDHPETYSAEEINLAWQLLSGTKKLKNLDADDRVMLNSITQRLYYGKYPPKVQPPPKRLPERRLEDDEGPPRDDDYDTLISKGQVDPSDG